MLPRIALTLGDVAGIGPEVVARALCDERLATWCRPVVVGHPDVLLRAVRTIGGDLDVCSIAEIASETPAGDKCTIPCWNPAGDDAALVPAGANDARAGRAAYEYLVAATKAALAGRIDAITTAPLSKAALHLAGLDYPGHTEILAELCGVRDFAMMLYLPDIKYLPGGGEQIEPHNLGVVHATLHTSIRSVPDLLTSELIQEKIGLIDRFMKRTGCLVPRIAVCALNPHAGEEGLFGDEERRTIAPAVKNAAKTGISVVGPLPADTLFKRACSGEFDGVVAMYHDQGHIALKLAGPDRAVNVTLGLPIVRTSPSHGTAFDIAWRGTARADGMIEAIRVAALLAGK
ncbi:MAG TPA: 4-hydroxythreonine-4-phosphate dehydrogenase PdxA [Planctomycetaceae bacterium]|jgi:4-hydroxythreonine-4-phosphate dehydrogenase